MALIIWTFVGKVMSLLFNTLSRLIIAFFLRSQHLLISWLQSPSTVILEGKKIKSVSIHPENLIMGGKQIQSFLGFCRGLVPRTYHQYQNPQCSSATVIYSGL